MLKGKIIYLRCLEMEDLEKTWQWHNDFEIQKMTCGPMRFVSKEIERKWIESKVLDNQKDIYLSICAIENNEMIGLISINNIDYLNRRCFCGGIVIGNKQYRDGQAYIESITLMKKYVFEQLNMHKLTGSCLETHIMSRAHMEIEGYVQDGILRDDVFKNGQYHNVLLFSLLRKDYYANLEKLSNFDEYFLLLGRKILEVKKQIKSKE